MPGARWHSIGNVMQGLFNVPFGFNFRMADIHNAPEEHFSEQVGE